VYILSVFITSNSVYLLVFKEGKTNTFRFSFYPSFQTEKDLEFLITSFLKSIKVKPSDCLFLVTSTINQFTLFGKPSFSLNELILKDKDTLYIYFDNLTLISQENVSSASLGLSIRSDNFVSNRSIFSAKVFNNDLEEVVFFSKSINKSLTTKKRKVIIGGDYFSNQDVPNEYKINLVSEILSAGFYEIYLDTNSEYPHFANLNIQTNIGYKSPKFEKFVYLFVSEKDMEFMLERRGESKYLEVKRGEVFFLHTDLESRLKEEKNPIIKFKGKEIGKGELEVDREFGGIFFDRRNLEKKKDNLGIESLREVISSIEKTYDYSSF
jgi:hypothetical protein